MLEYELDETTWLQVVQRYVKSNAEKLVTTSDLQVALEEETGERMDWFFDQWVYGVGFPNFDVNWKFDETNKRLRVTARQVQKDTIPQFFQGKMSLAIDGQIRTVRIEPQANNVFEFDLAKRPLLVNFDHRDVWIKETTFDKPLDELIYQLLHDSDVLGQQPLRKRSVRPGTRAHSKRSSN